MLKIIVIVYLILEIITSLLIVNNDSARNKMIESLEESINNIKTNPKIVYNKIGIYSIITLIVILWL